MRKLFSWPSSPQAYQKVLRGFAMSHMRVWLLSMLLCAAPLVAVGPDQEDEKRALPPGVVRVKTPSYDRAVRRSCMPPEFLQFSDSANELTRFKITIGGRPFMRPLLSKGEIHQSDVVIVSLAANPSVSGREEIWLYAAGEEHGYGRKMPLTDAIRSGDVDGSSMHNLLRSLERLLKVWVNEKVGRQRLICDTVQTLGEEHAVYTLDLTSCAREDRLFLSKITTCIDHVINRGPLPDNFRAPNLHGLASSLHYGDRPLSFPRFPDSIRHCRVFTENLPGPFRYLPVDSFAFFEIPMRRDHRSSLE